MVMASLALSALGQTSYSQTCAKVNGEEGKVRKEMFLGCALISQMQVYRRQSTGQVNRKATAKS